MRYVYLGVLDKEIRYWAFDIHAIHVYIDIVCFGHIDLINRAGADDAYGVSSG